MCWVPPSMWSSTVSHNATLGNGPCTSSGGLGITCYEHGGGGISSQSSGSVSLVNVTVSGNTVADTNGAGIWANSSTTALYSTIADNTVTGLPSGFPGVDEGGRAVQGPLRIGGSVVAGTGQLCPSGTSVSPTWRSLGSNLVEQDGCFYDPQPSDQQGTSAGLSPLGDHGGPTPTHLPGPSLVDAVALDWIGGCGLTLDDQKGTDRPVGSGCDIGAVERTAADGAGAPVLVEPSPAAEP